MIFRLLCDLLSDIEAIVTRDPPLLPKARNTLSRNHIIQWFNSHRTLIDSTDAVALLSTLLPERRTDRVYNLQPPSLVKVISRCLLVGASRQSDLQRWKEPGGGDLGACVERVLKGSEFPCQLGKEVILEQVDAVLSQVARRSRFSGPNIKQKDERVCAVAVDRELASIYRRLQSREAKWFTRLILKDLSPVQLPEELVLKCFHCLLPSLLECQDNFQAAINTLQGSELRRMSLTTENQKASTLKALIAETLVPKVGVKVGRPRFLKAHSIKHAAQMAQGRRMSLERKYDGEYCQIHIDLHNSHHEIQIFSKSGKDSTFDRVAVHETVRKSLRIGDDNCGFSSHCILEGELLVWSDLKAKILDFHKIRKHVSRSGVFLGTEKDSQPHPWEHLMIMFYDVMLVDDDPILKRPLVQRRQRLGQLITPIPGRAGLATHEEINFSSREAHHQLLRALATAFVQGWEGFVMKPVDESYVRPHGVPNNSYSSCWIKLKKDYISGVGDTAEFAIVGAGYRAATATKLLATQLPWTHFHIGCLQNKEKVLRGGEKPKFLVIDCIDYGMSKGTLEGLCQKGKFRAEKIGSSRANDAFDCSIETHLSCPMDVVFTEPFVFELKGFGFDKPPSRDYFILRFPGLVKIHWDRTFRDALSFDELQRLAVEANNVPNGDIAADVIRWTEKLLRSERGLNKGRAPWEDTQEHDEDDAALDISASFLGDATNQANTFRAPIMVRMDTLEMSRNQKGSNSNRAVSTTYPEPSGNTSVSSSVSMIPQLSLRIIDNQVIRKQPSSRKRLLDHDHFTDTIPSKRRRTKSLATKISAHQYLSASASSSSKDGFFSPLKEIINEAQRRRPHSPTKNKETAEKTTLLELDPACKFPINPERRLLTRKPNPKPKIPAASSSSSSFLLGIPVSTTATSNSSHRIFSKTISTAPPSSLPKSQPPITSRLSRPPPPNLRNCILILSPCISHMPYLLEDLFLPFHPTILALTTSNTSPILSPTDHHKPVVVLVESYHGASTGQFLRSLLGIMAGMCRGSLRLRKEGTLEAEIWDWRMVEEYKKKKIGKCAFRWYVGTLKVESKEGGWGVMEWATGEVSKVVRNKVFLGRKA